MTTLWNRIESHCGPRRNRYVGADDRARKASINYGLSASVCAPKQAEHESDRCKLFHCRFPPDMESNFFDLLTAVPWPECALDWLPRLASIRRVRRTITVLGRLVKMGIANAAPPAAAGSLTI